MFDHINPQVKTSFGFYFMYNVCQASGPIKEMGRVYFVVDDFGSLVMVSSSNLSISLS